MTSKKGLSHFVLIYAVIILNKTFSFVKKTQIQDLGQKWIILHLQNGTVVVL
jgi:hypothetical protein